MKNKLIEIIKKKWLRSIVMTIVLFAIIIAAYVGILYGVKQLHIDDIDFTKEKVYSISQATKDKLQNLEEQVTISIYNMYNYVEDFAYKYANLNHNIKVEKLENLNAHTDWKTNYGITETSAFLVIHTKGKEKLLLDSNLYTMDYTTYDQIDITEEAITNAILDVTTNVKPKICFLAGHELYPQNYFQYLQNSLYSEVNEVEFVDILKKGSVPEDCKVLVLTAPKNDITAKEKDSILSYIHKGGELLVLLDPNLNKTKTPNFDKILEEYGASISEGFILEGDTNKMMYGAPSFVISTINNSSELAKNINMDLNVCMMNPGKITIASQEQLEKKNVTMQILAQVSDKAFYRTDLTAQSTSKISSDEDAAEAVVAAMFTKQNSENNESKMILFANTAFATNMEIPFDTQYYMYAISVYNNEDVLLNAVSYLTQREDNITIRKTGEAVSTYNVSLAQLQIVSAIIFAIPIFIILMGIVVWILRRRKK